MQLVHEASVCQVALERLATPPKAKLGEHDHLGHLRFDSCNEPGDAWASSLPDVQREDAYDMVGVSAELTADRDVRQGGIFSTGDCVCLSPGADMALARLGFLATAAP